MRFLFGGDTWRQASANVTVPTTLSAFAGDAHRRDPRRISLRMLRALDEMARRDASAKRA
ncbi:hypothetical protein C6T53_23575 [Burkholderia multivorans]|nr:hypothetical protein C6T53_23575 [Burkholderia multivorans]